MSDTCPACGAPTSVHGCVTHEQAGTFCRAPDAPAPRLRATDKGAAIVTHDPPPRPRVTFPVPPAAPRVPCKSCRAPIVWIETRAGKRMPLNPDTGESHFATCPHAATWRKDR